MSNGLTSAAPHSNGGRIDPASIERARASDIREAWRRLGLPELNREGKVCSPWRSESHPSVQVGGEKNIVYDHGSGETLDSIDLARRARSCSFAEAVIWLNNGHCVPARSQAKAKPAPILPIPADAGPPMGKHFEHGEPSHVWAYKDSAGRFLGYVYRFDVANGKEIIPQTYCRHPDGTQRWTWKQFDEPRPLYGLDRLAQRPAAPVLWCEGEKSADAGGALFPEYVAIASPGGSGAVGKAGYTPLTGRTVYIWPDADEPGRAAALGVARLVLAAGAVAALIVPVPDDFPKGWDVADDSPDGWDAARLASLIDAAKPYSAGADLPDLASHEARSESVANVVEAASSSTAAVLAGFNLTDDGNGRAIEFLSSDQLKFDHGRATWFSWAGSHWRPDQDGAAARRAIEAIKSRGRAAFDAPGLDKDRRESLVSFALRCENQNRLNAALDAAKRQPAIATTTEQWDRNPLLFACADSTLDLRTGESRAPDPADRITMVSPARLTPGTECARWLRFLHEVTGGDSDLILFLWRAIGYTLTGLTTEQCFFILHGTGANGKSVFLKIVAAMLGDYHANAEFSSFMPQKNSGAREDLARLAGKRMVSAKESSESARLDEGTVKALTGGDCITARFFYRGSFEYEPVFKLWLATNHKPRISGGDHGIWRRIRLIPFTQQFSPDQEPGLTDMLMGELDGILQWAAQGALEWQQHGLGWPATVREATEAYRTGEDVLGQFLEEQTEPVALGEVAAGELYNAFRDWLAKGNEQTISQTAFGRKLTDRGFQKKRTGSGVVWLGLRLV